MEAVTKRQRLEVLIAKHNVIDKNTAFQLLTKVEVRDAMNFVIASGNDPRFQYIATLMQEEEIWKFWMMRDMRVVYNVLFGGQLPVWIQFNPNPIVDRPLWKLCYLWYRIVVGQFQYSFVERVNRRTALQMYPPDSQLEYEYLNVLKLTVAPAFSVNGNNVLYLDFATEYPRMALYMGVDEEEEIVS